jgi:hypothetical protein
LRKSLRENVGVMVRFMCGSWCTIDSVPASPLDPHKQKNRHRFAPASPVADADDGFACGRPMLDAEVARLARAECIARSVPAAARIEITKQFCGSGSAVLSHRAKRAQVMPTS